MANLSYVALILLPGVQNLFQFSIVLIIPLATIGWYLFIGARDGHWKTDIFTFSKNRYIYAFVIMSAAWITGVVAALYLFGIVSDHIYTLTGVFVKMAFLAYGLTRIASAGLNAFREYVHGSREMGGRGFAVIFALL